MPRAWVVDASVAAKWFRPVESEPDGQLAREAIDRLPMRITSLTLYEVGNVLIRHSGWSGPRVGAAIDLLREICGDPLALLPEDHAATAELALTHGLSFYDASYVTIANRMGRQVLSADADLLDPGLAVDLATVL
ncbi:MAG TPA: type II toxin-antitoxin system VapC family toxin [Solirubrobacterales bacterium]|nr:type II toxin-antitoxin system VapC family toxin [Solirubrobacterales bacterium]